MESKKSTPKKNTVTVTIPSENSHGIPVFEDFMAEAQRRFQIEVDAKNEAYSFILSTGRLNEFAEFHKSTRGINHHNNCVDRILLMIPNQQ